jgi:Flp pilus assembly protein TadD
MTTLGVALYRTGAYGEAAETLVETEGLLSNANQEVGPAIMAFKAMALSQLGRSEQARAELQRLRALLGNHPELMDEIARALLEEAQTAIGMP